ncbi:restriction endonuclease subunit S [Vibrio vulnificus]|uniref:Restriction endonuclease subunit S n=1 Tax=Vibrio vulnificus TaxID=672 RepID=A0A2S3R362_VIBVL|nr:restriction endonuclease subunit S [Vibrio vulnificus]EHD1698918.1 restriction endonuclease subunit S [Vibrio vulnificus]MCR9502599.1 restriction endonuclease subunit S [Vibrio vulnificus]POB48132.1 restriction endonuclease subunit S [Vibrio vulnificus]HAS6023043.1 restriction endonuclease subunit S [Vibrio vulnificus]HAS6032441.1 restriction endonuclease subunit S [Vibrio vulnificus]
MAGRYKAYSEYKRSNHEWLGDVPSHWDVVYSKWLFNERNDKANQSDEMLTASQKYGVIPQGMFMQLEQQKVVQVQKGHDILKQVKRNDFVISMRSFQGGIEFCEYNGAVSSAYVPLEPKTELNLSYFKYLFKSKPYIQALQATTNLVRDGQALRYNNFLQVKLPVPQHNEAEKIGSFLDHETAKIDTLIAKQEKLIELLKEKRQAVISHAVTKGLNPDAPMKDSGVEWLGEVPEHWKVSKLKFESSVVDCRNKTPEYFDDGEYFVVRTTNVKNQNLNFNGALYTNEKNFKVWTQRGVPPVGSILFTREAPTGEVCRVPDNLKFCMGQRMMNFIANDELYSDYLFDYLISDCLERYIGSVSHGSTVSHLRVEQVENIPVLVPPQNEITNIHNEISKLKKKYDALEAKALATIDLMKERKTALISAAVTGKIDVRHFVAEQEQPQGVQG